MKTETQTQQILILGGGYAGMIAAARIARGAEISTQVTLIDAKPDFVQRIRLHEILAGRSPETLAYAPLLAKRGVTFLQAWAESIDPVTRRVMARRMDGASVELRYDQLILALGSTTAPGMPGVAEHAVRLDDPAALREVFLRLRNSGAGARILVAGAGLTGIETAAELAERFPQMQVTLATRGRLGDGFSPSGAGHLRRSLTGRGVVLREEARITAVEPGRAIVSGSAPLPFDLCLWCGGFAAPPLARQAGLPVDACGRVRTDETLRVPGHPEIFAAGDSAAAPAAGSPGVRMGCNSALPMGAQAGNNVVRLLRGEKPEPLDFAFAVRCISLGRTDGLVQHVTGDDSPRDRVWTGRLAVLVKELICRMTLFVVRWELRAGLRLYRWPRLGRVVQSAGSRSAEEARHLHG
jgi:NADH:ubiquinone reductase (H+-translocating)